MKLKSHSGTKKRVKVRKSGRKFLQKSCKNHLLTHKSKRQKDAFDKGKPIPSSHNKILAKLLPYS